MKTKFTNNLFKKSVDLNTSNVIGGVVATSGTSFVTITGGGCDSKTENYNEDGKQVYCKESSNCYFNRMNKI